MTQNDSAKIAAYPRRAPRLANGLFLGVLAVGAVALLGAALATPAVGAPFGRWRHHSHDAESVKEHARFGAEWMLRYVDASEEQEDQVYGIIDRAVSELFPVTEQHRGHREEMVRILREPEVDRAALEELRRAELELADEASQSLVDALADLVEVLTPEQREELLALGDHFHR